jgi:predicted ATP-dependent endonuclease of OLD family
MKIKELKLINFQCFKKEEIELDDLTVFIGANSSGKTAVQEALLKLFGRDRSQRNIKNSDFYLAKEENFNESEKRELSLEAVIEVRD